MKTHAPPTPEQTAAVDAAITTRRSLRAFLPTPVLRETIEDILRVASRAPSGTNTQPWRVYVLTGEPLADLARKITAVYNDPAAAATHREEYAYYPTEWRAPFIDRRRKVGWDLYGLLGIGKADKPRMHAQHGRNYTFFDAPVGLLFTIDRVMQQGSWLDYGMFLQNVMVAARGRGLDTCPQAAFTPYHRIICEHVGAPANEMLVCGMSLGHADPDAPENTLVTEREPVVGFTTFSADVHRPTAAPFAVPTPALANPLSAIDGAQLGLAWAVPFAGLLLSIALLPLVAPAFWHRHFGKLAAGWSLALLLPFAAAFGPATAAHTLWHALLTDYLPFVVLLTALFTVAGGIHLRGTPPGSPAGNASMLAVGAALASVMGTTGAAMLLIRPLLRANAHRRGGGAHVVVFFIFIVGNAGGALTPLGDPPLFLGFLQGVDFFWTLRQLWPQTLFLVGALLAVFYGVDRWHTARHAPPVDAPPAPRTGFGIDGAVNLLPLAAIVALVLISGNWQPGIAFDVVGTTIGLPSLLRDAALVAVIAVSLAITPRGVRQANGFSWAPMAEVAKLFAAIFVTMAPVLAMLGTGRRGAFAGVAAAVTGVDGEPLPRAYFWLTGALSAFLDNAPTYLVFFRLAGGDAQALMTRHAATLAAISAGAVFMGALTYIGNAPNFMVKAIAEDRGVRMPGFFGYLLWSGAVLLPLLAAMTLIWF